MVLRRLPLAARLTDKDQAVTGGVVILAVPYLAPRKILRWEPRTLVVQVSDDGRPGLGPATGGHGLAELRERLALFGGSMTSGPVPAGGWAVSARLPLPGQAA